MITCNRCGQCCYVNNKKCKYLIKIGSKTGCRKYNNRLGTKTSPISICAMRDQDHTNYPGCPYNRDEWEK